MRAHIYTLILDMWKEEGEGWTDGGWDMLEYEQTVEVERDALNIKMIETTSKILLSLHN